MSVRIINGDCRDALRSLPAESVHCCVTSPPYFGLRDYGVEGQIGLEPTPAAFVEAMVGVFRDVRRVLREDGTLWLNLGDSYSSGGRTARDTTSLNKGNLGSAHRYRPADGLKPKDLIGVPWRVAFALQSDGWYLRSAIVWHKPNPMPESVTDRPTSSYEMVFLFAKSERYFYDADAIKEVSVRSGDVPGGGVKYSQSITAPGSGKQNLDRLGGKQVAETKNARNVWTIATEPFPGSHFATMAPDLAERCIKAGCPQGGTVLDPFGGAGTTGLVADRLQRDAILIELNPEYAAMARRRIESEAGMFAAVTEAAE